MHAARTHGKHYSIRWQGAVLAAVAVPHLERRHAAALCLHPSHCRQLQGASPLLHALQQRFGEQLGVHLAGGWVGRQGRAIGCAFMCKQGGQAQWWICSMHMEGICS